jgi:hypothetical protein
MTVRDVIGTLIAADGPWSRWASQVDSSCRSLLGRPAGLVELVLSIRDMPYARPSSFVDSEIILDEWKGTCSSKHILLTQLLERLGIATTLYMGAYPVCPATAGLPDELLGMLGRPEQPFWDVHNYVRADIKGRLLIDITWPTELSHYPFFRTTRWWDGQSNFRLAADVSEERVMSPNAGGIAAKKVWLEELNPDPRAQAAREEFITSLAKFTGNNIPVARLEETIEATIGALAHEEKNIAIRRAGHKETWA